MRETLTSALFFKHVLAHKTIEDVTAGCTTEENIFGASVAACRQRVRSFVGTRACRRSDGAWRGTYGSPWSRKQDVRPAQWSGRLNAATP